MMTRSRYALWAALAVLLGVAFVSDNVVLAAIKPFHESPGAETIRQTVRWLGTGYLQAPVALIMVVAGLVWSRRVKQAGAWALLAFAVSGLAANVLKVIVRRPRPWTTDALPANWYGYLHNGAFHSFPSAETATTFAVVLIIGDWFPVLRAPLVVVAVLVGLARVLVGSHHPSDVVAGAMLGIAVSQAIASMTRQREARTDSGDRAR
jgi:membrane-associated phospholipid phosphatase